MWRWVLTAQRIPSIAQFRLSTNPLGLVGSPEDALDLSQEAFLKAWKALPRFEAKAKFSTWLYRIVHNVVYDWTRRRRPESADEWNEELLSREKIDPASRTTPAGALRPDASLSNSELREKIEEALDTLSPEHREAVLLKDVQGLAYKEIADCLSIPIGTVMSPLHRGRKALERKLWNVAEQRGLTGRS